MLKKVSIIIPAYNMEKYISKCLDSVLQQDYANLEVIVINDGSTDGTEKICQNYVKMDGRIRFITRPNGGVAEATNMGLDMQTGDFILFLDSDDYLPQGVITKMVEEILQDSADVVQGGVITETEEGCLLVKEQFERQIIYGENEIMKKHLGEMLIGGNLAQKLFRAELFESIRMPQGRNLADVSTMLKIISRCKVYKIIPDISYIAVKRNNSVSMSMLNDNGYADIMFYIELIEQMDTEENARVSWCIKFAILKMLIMCYNRVHQSECVTDKILKEKEILARYAVDYKVWRKVDGVKNILLIQRIKMRVFRIAPKIYAAISHK